MTDVVCPRGDSGDMTRWIIMSRNRGVAAADSRDGLDRAHFQRLL